MPNVAAILKGEIVRLSRKTVKQQLAPLRSITAAQRRHLAALRKQVSALERELTTLRRAAVSKTTAPESGDTPTRFVAKGLVSLRSRLGLSAEDLGKLVGASAVSVYNWEHKKAKPRPSILASIASLKSLGKREAQARLEVIKSAPAPKSAATKATRGKARRR